MNYIRFKKNNLCVENLSAYKLTKSYKTPFYCYSLAQLKKNYYLLKDTFKISNPNATNLGSSSITGLRRFTNGMYSPFC